MGTLPGALAALGGLRRCTMFLEFTSNSRPMTGLKQKGSLRGHTIGAGLAPA